MGRKSRLSKFKGSLQKYIDTLKLVSHRPVGSSFGLGGPGLRELLNATYINSDYVPEDDKFLVEIIQNIPYIQLLDNHVFRNTLKERLKYYEENSRPKVL